MKFLSLVLGLLALFLSPNVRAVLLTWDECLRATQEGNPTLDASKKDWLAQQMNERVAFAGFLPRLSASTSLTKTGTTGKGGGGAVVTNGVVLNTSAGSQVNSNYLAALNFSQNIFNGLEDRSRVEQAEWRSKNSFWNYMNTKSNVSFSLKQGFANLLYAQETMALSQSVFERRESNYKLVSVRYDNGRENKGSVLLAEAYFEQAKLDLIRARDATSVAQEQLKSLMNKEHLDQIEVNGEIPLLGLALERGLSDLAIETPAYNQAHAQEMVSQEDIAIARANFLPNLDITAQSTRQGVSYFPEKERWTVALVLTIPLFDGLRDLSTYRSSVFTKYAAEGRKKNVLLDLIPRLRDTYTQAKQSDLKFVIDGKFRLASSTRAEIARAKYNNGLLSFEDWDIIENELILRQTNYLQSKRDRTLKYAAWENLLGKGSI